MSVTLSTLSPSHANKNAKLSKCKASPWKSDIAYRQEVGLLLPPNILTSSIPTVAKIVAILVVKYLITIPQQRLCCYQEKTPKCSDLKNVEFPSFAVKQS